jgi:transcriptional regulator with XRE-family HTH domain
LKPEVAFGDVLRELRKSKNLSQEALALESGLDRTFVSLLKRGLRQPSLASILHLAKTLDVTASEMLVMVEAKQNDER